VFDLDGVVTDTARVHAAAWKEVFDGFLGTRDATGDPSGPPFDEADYLAYVDGKNRYEGAAAFLDARRIALPWGSPTDPATAITVCGLGNAKDDRFNARLRSDGVLAFPGTLALIAEMEGAGMDTAIVSASRNCRQVLAAAGLEGVFDALVDGLDADHLGLASKPDPAIFLEAAHRLGHLAGRLVVFEDAVAGVAAGRRGRFGIVVGVDRHRHPTRLLEAGADVVVADLAEVRVDA
jgi:alpha,alpha-trehalase